MFLPLYETESCFKNKFLLQMFQKKFISLRPRNLLLHYIIVGFSPYYIRICTWEKGRARGGGTLILPVNNIRMVH